MLLKLDNLAEIGRFTSLRHKAPQFSKLALIYARNAHGKSTICAILNSAATGEVAMVGARKRLGSVAAPTASFLWGADLVSFAAGAWNRCPGPLHVFDQEYVEKNVHIAGSVTRANKRQLLQVVVGEPGILLAAEIEQLDAELKQIAADQAAATRVIQAAHKAVTNVEAYCAGAVPEDIDARIDQRQRGVQLARRAAAVGQRSDLQKIQALDLAIYEDELAASIDGVSASAAQQVAQHIEQHAMAAAGARWLKFGVEHTLGTECPYCTQDTSTVPLVAAFKGYFSDAYGQHAQRIEETQKALQTSYGEHGQALDGALEKLLADVPFWAEVSELPVHPSLTADDRKTIGEAIKALRDAFDLKVASPLEALSLGDERNRAAQGLAALAAFNQQLDACASAIAQARADAANADLAKAMQMLDLHQAWKAKGSEPMKSEAEGFNRRKARQGEIATKKAELQQQLKNYVAQTVTSRQGEINRLLRRFGANFEVSDTKASFVGREPNTEFSVVLGRHTIKAGEESDEAPSFKTVLSAGDKFTLALAFFLTQVRADPRLADAAIILDDPFSSQDMQRQFETASEVRSLSAAACQVVVLSHDPRFLHLIEKDVEDASCSTFQIVFDDDTTAAIKEWSSAKELETLYVRQAERIRYNADTGNFLKGCSAESLVKELRPFTEEFVKLRYPGRFGPLVMLEAMADEIAAAGQGDPLFKDVADLKALNVYSRQYMHGGAAPPDPDQLRAQCGRIVDIIGHY